MKNTDRRSGGFPLRRAACAALASAWMALAGMAPGCAPDVDATVASEEALIDGTEDFRRVAGVGSDYAANDVDNWSRNATVVILPQIPSGFDFASACSGVLVSPRIVLTAAHCVRSSESFAVFFGPLGFPAFAGFSGSALLSDGAAVPGGTRLEQEASSSCHVHPDNTWDITCGDGFPIPALVSGADSQFDLAVLVLNQRVDRHVGDTGFGPHAIPATPVRSPPGLVVATHAGFGEVGRCPSVGVPTTVPVLRQAIEQNILCTGSAPGSSACFDHLLTLTPYGGQHGDSGGPIYLGRTLGRSSLGPLTVAGVFSSFIGGAATCASDAHDLAVSLGDARVVEWLETFLGAGYTGTTVDGLWTGPDDVPRASDPGRTDADWLDDPDGDGLVGDHDTCWGVNDPTQELRSGFCLRRVWTPPASPEDCATEMGTVRVNFECVGPSATPVCDADGLGSGGELGGGGGDADQDGIPNDCDPCPCNPSPQMDCDGDGVGNDCDPDFADGCAGIVASRPMARRDSNVDAEIAFGGPACALHLDQASCQTDLGHACSWLPSAGGFRCTSGLRDECDINPVVNVEPFAVTLPPSPTLPGRGIFSGGLRGHAVIGSPSSRARETTYRVGMRWCPCSLIERGSLDERVLCGRPGPTGTTECPVNDGREFDRAIESTAPWQGMRYSVTTPRVLGTFDSVTGTIAIPHHFPDLTAPRDLIATWDFTTDVSTQSRLEVTTNSFGDIVRERLRAEVWTHDARAACRGTDCPPAYTRELASHFTGENFEWVPVVPPPFDPPPMRPPPIALPLPEPICTVCAVSFPAPFLSIDDCFASGTCVDPTWSVRLGTVQIDGTAFLSRTASARLVVPGQTFVVPSEPIGMLFPHAVRLVGLDADLQPTLALVARGAQMLEVREGNQQLKAPGDPPGVLLFGNLHQVVRVGGALAPTLTWLDLDTGATWDTWMTGDAPTDVAALAGGIDYSEVLVVERRHEEGAASECDGLPPGRERGECAVREHRHRRHHCEAHGHGADRMQIVHGDLHTRSFTRLASVRRTGRFDAWWLVPLPDGSYVLVASSSSRGVHAVARLELEDARHGRGLEVRITHVENGSGAIVSPPIGSFEGVTVAATDRRSWRTIGYRIEDLAGRHDGRGTSRRLEDLF